jgi:hypothetical protein
VEILISTNGITATGNAGNQLLQGLGSAAGQFVEQGRQSHALISGHRSSQINTDPTKS